MSFVSGGGIPTGGPTNITVPSTVSGKCALAMACEYNAASPPTSIGGTLGGVSLGAFVQSADNGTSGIWLFELNQALLTSIGSGTKSLATAISGGVGVQGKQAVFVFYEGRVQTAGVATNATGSGTIQVPYTCVAAGADVFAGYGSDSFGSLVQVAPFTSVYSANDAGGDAGAGAEYAANQAAGAGNAGWTAGTTPWSMVGIVFEALPAGANCAWVTA